jgi:hypothetical protein
LPETIFCFGDFKYLKGDNMKKIMFALLLVLILGSFSAWAADAEFPKAEVFGGFSVASIDAGSERINPLGFQASVAGNFHKNIGVVADFGGQYKDGGHIYEYLFGPRVTARQGKANIFAHALFGGAAIGADGESLKGFAMGIGGGIDANINDRFAVRVIQFDWIPARFEGEWFKDTVRFGFGIVIKK